MKCIPIVKNKTQYKNVINCRAFQKWKFGTVNIRSGKEKDEGAKIYAIAKQIAKLELSFCCIQEVKYRNSGKKLIELDSGEKFEFHWSGMKKRREVGVGILFKCDENILLSKPDVTEPRIIAFNMKIYGFNVRLVNAYAPTECGSDFQKDLFYRMLRKSCIKTEKHQKLILAGDFNATTSTALLQCNYNGSQIVSDEICNDNGSRLKSFCRNNKLCMSSTYFDHPEENRYTWYSPDQRTKKKLDYVLVDWFVQQYITNCMSHPEIDFDTDHKILIAELDTPKTRKARWRKRKTTLLYKKDVQSLREPAIHKQFSDKVGDRLNSVSLTRDTTTETSAAILNALHDAANTTLSDVKKKNTAVETWKCDGELNRLLNLRMEQRLGSDTHKELTRQIKKRVKHLRNERLRQQAIEINNHANNRKIEQMFRQFKSDHSAFKQIKNNKKCEPEKLRVFFQKHFNNLNEPSAIDATDVGVIGIFEELSHEALNSNAPDINEITDVIKSLQNGKAANDVPVEYIKAAITNKKFLQEMVQLYQTIWQTKVIPTSWSHSKLVAIWKGAKKGGIDDPEAYRALQIGSSLGKILVVVIIKRIQAWYEQQLTGNQQGFRRGRGTADGIYIVKRIHQITDQMKKTVYALFVDLTAAFDHVPRRAMFRSIKKRLPDRESRKLIDLLELLYSHTTTALAEEPEKVFSLKTGVRQGGPESPMLFNLYLDFVMRIFLQSCSKSKIKFLKLKYRIPRSASHSNQERVGYQQIDWIGYADDLILVFDSKKDLQKALTILDTLFVKFGLAINASKTKTMILNHQIPVITIQKQYAV